MQNFWERVESHDSQTSESYPDSPKDEGHKGRRNGKKINHGVKLKHKHQLVIGSYKSHEEIGHEEDIENEVKLKNVKEYKMRVWLVTPLKFLDIQKHIFPPSSAEHHRSK